MLRLYHLGTLILGLGLLALGTDAILRPEGAAVGYGVPAEDVTWIRATGLRDVALGALTLGVRWRHPEALQAVLLAVLVLPLGDAVLVLSAGQPPLATAPHVLGAVAVAGLLVLGLF